ncbi:glutathione peroxidase [soil metagenome]
MSRLYDLSATDIKGGTVPLDSFRGDVLLIVNTASKCGFTPQFSGLQKLHSRYHARGFSVLGFPCNQFLNQDPAGREEIANFCTATYSVSFPMFDKVDVNGPHAHPLYQWLTDAAPGLLGTKAIKWNFTKFLIDRSGHPVVRYGPTMAPSNIAPTIERHLARSA